MTVSEEYERWRCRPADLIGLDAIRARDLIVECFYQAKHEELLRSQELVGLAPNESQTRIHAEGFVRNAFRRTGGDFKNPDKASLIRVVICLAEISSHYGTPADIIEHHSREIGRVLDALRD